MALRLTEPQLEEMARVHIRYEVQRLMLPVRPPEYFVRASSPGVENFAREWLGQTILESALLHLRALTAFLIQTRPTQPKYLADLVAADYFDDEWVPVPNINQIGRKTWLFRGGQEPHASFMDELHRRLAHITTHRIGPGFSWSEVTVEVPTLIGEFERFVTELRAVHPDRAQWFDWTLP